MGVPLKKFVKEISILMPRLHTEFVKRQGFGVTSGQVTLPQMGILMLLRGEGPCRMSEIAKALSVTTPAATGIISRMVRAGFIKRIAGVKDRRVIRVELTKKGKRVIDEIVMKKEKMMTEAFSTFSANEREQYLKLFRKIYVSLTGDKG